MPTMSERRNQKAETGGLLGAKGQLELDSEFKSGLDNTYQQHGGIEEGQSVKQVLVRVKT